MQIPMALMGGVALSVWEHIRATRDVDWLVSFSTEKIDAVLQGLTQAGIRPLRQPPVLDLGDVKIMQTIYEVPGTYTDIRIDFLFAGRNFNRKPCAAGAEKAAGPGLRD